MARTFQDARNLWVSRLIGDGQPASVTPPVRGGRRAAAASREDGPRRQPGGKGRPGVANYIRVVAPLESQGKSAGWETENHYDPLLAFRYVKALVGDFAAGQPGEAGGAPDCDQAIDLARSQYLRYVELTKGNVPGHRNWTRGLRLDFEATGNPRCKEAILLLSTRMFASDSVKTNRISTFLGARELAFALQSHIDARALGQAPRARTLQLLGFALDVIDQWTIPGYWKGTKDYPREWFGVHVMMCGLLARSLIHYHDEIEANPAIVPKVKQLCDWLWEHTWNARAMAFPYWDRDTKPIVDRHGAHPDAFDGPGQPKPTPILNPLTGPAYAWLATVCDPNDRTTCLRRYEDAFIGSAMAGGVDGKTDISQQKQFNQALFWEPEGLTWRRKALDRIEAERPTRRGALRSLREGLGALFAGGSDTG
jgi:hypothetical protein